MNELKRMDGPALVAALLAETNFAGFELNMLLSAIDLGSVLHRYQVRQETTPDGRVNPPYFEHPLRNTLRLVRWGVRDLDVLVASLLHDTVEDCSLVYVETYTALNVTDEPEARLLLSNYILHRFGYRVQYLVMGVTNPYYTPKAWAAYTPEQRRRIYGEKVSESVKKDPGIFLVKLADFIDNAGSLHWIPAERAKTALRLAQKYYPLIDVFAAAAAAHDFRGIVDSVEPALFRLEEARERLQAILVTHSKEQR